VGRASPGVWYQQDADGNHSVHACSAVGSDLRDGGAMASGADGDAFKTRPMRWGWASIPIAAAPGRSSCPAGLNWVLGLVVDQLPAPTAQGDVLRPDPRSIGSPRPCYTGAVPALPNTRRCAASQRDAGLVAGPLDGGQLPATSGRDMTSHVQHRRQMTGGAALPALPWLWAAGLNLEDLQLSARSRSRRCHCWGASWAATVRDRRDRGQRLVAHSFKTVMGRMHSTRRTGMCSA
jgi:hypothetical protein